MIQLMKAANPKLILTPRMGFKRSHHDMELPLLYGHTCPACSNVINAVVRADKLIDLLPYEETAILVETKEGTDVKKVVRGGYEMTLYRGANKEEGSLLRLRLRNHLVPPKALKDKGYATGLEESGEKPCFKTGFHNLREDLMMKDIYMAFGIAAQTLQDCERMPTVKEIFQSGDHHLNDFRPIPAVGNALPVILVDRTMLRTGNNYWLVQSLEPFKKKS